MGSDGYHHGDLRAALLAEAEAELAARGVEAFSLRGVAKRAGVSHAAPAHHFRDAAGLLSALAAEGYRRFLAAQMTREEGAADAREKLLASGMAYVDFALANPALFRLMFGSRKPDFSSDELKAAGEAAFDHLVANMRAATGRDPETDQDARLRLARIWSVVHGLAELLMNGRLDYVRELPDAGRRAAIREIIAASF